MRAPTTTAAAAAALAVVFATSALAKPYFQLELFYDDACGNTLGSYRADSQPFLTVILSSLQTNMTAEDAEVIKYITDSMTCTYLESLLPSMGSSAQAQANTSSTAQLLVYLGNAAGSPNKCIDTGAGAYARFQCSESKEYGVQSTPDEFVVAAVYPTDTSCGSSSTVLLTADIPSVGYANSQYSALTSYQFFCLDEVIYMVNDTTATVPIINASSYTAVGQGSTGLCLAGSTGGVHVSCAAGKLYQENPPFHGVHTNVATGNGSLALPGGLTATIPFAGYIFSANIPISSMFPPYNGIGVYWFFEMKATSGSISWAYNDTYLDTLGYKAEDLIFVEFDMASRSWIPITSTSIDKTNKVITANSAFVGTEWTIVSKQATAISGATITAPSFLIVAVTVVISTLFAM